MQVRISQIYASYVYVALIDGDRIRDEIGVEISATAEQVSPDNLQQILGTDEWPERCREVCSLLNALISDCKETQSATAGKWKEKANE